MVSFLPSLPVPELELLELELELLELELELLELLEPELLELELLELELLELELELLPGLLELGASVPPQAVSNETDITAANATAAIFLDNLILKFLLFFV